MIGNRRLVPLVLSIVAVVGVSVLVANSTSPSDVRASHSANSGPTEDASEGGSGSESSAAGGGPTGTDDDQEPDATQTDRTESADSQGAADSQEVGEEVVERATCGLTEDYLLGLMGLSEAPDSVDDTLRDSVLTLEDSISDWSQASGEDERIAAAIPLAREVVNQWRTAVALYDQGERRRAEQEVERSQRTIAEIGDQGLSEGC